MTDQKNNKRLGRWLSLILAAVLLLVGVGIGVSLADSPAVAPGESVTVTYSAGQYLPHGKAYTKTKYDETKKVWLVERSDAGEQLKSENWVDTELFSAFADNITVTGAGTLILPQSTFALALSENGVTPSKTGDARLDDETFYFDTLGTGESYSSKWAYTFTGWHIVGAADRIPGETVFQPGDVIIPSVLEKYASDGSLELEALWGKCYFIENPYETMKYSKTKVDVDANGNPVLNAAGSPVLLYTLDTAASTGATGADDNNEGNDPSRPKATIDGLYAAIREELMTNEGGITAQRAPRTYDCYYNVVMLVGDLEYYTDTNQKLAKYYGYAETPSSASTAIFVSATYKSLGNTNYNYRYKSRGYSNTIFGNLRFDNVDFLRKPETKGQEGYWEQETGVEFMMSYMKTTDTSYINELIDRDGALDKSYMEFTARYNADFDSKTETQAISTLRPNDATYVVVNGGNFTGMQNQYSSAVVTGKQLYWTLGRNVRISGTLTCGTTSDYESNCINLWYDYNVYVLGGYINEFCGGSFGANSISAGKRNITLLGNGGSSTEYNPQIKNLYGGASRARLFADITLIAKYCTKLENVYGGGRDYSATTYGDIKVIMDGCKLSGDLFGGGKNGNCEKTPADYYQYEVKNGETTSTFKPIEDLMGGKLVDEGVVTEGHGGDVVITLENTTVNGNIFGSGMGQTQLLDMRTQHQVTKTWQPSSSTQLTITKEENVIPSEFGESWEPVTGYPSYNPENGRVLVYGFNSGTYTSNAPDNMAYYINHSYAYLSLATVENVSISLESSVVGSEESANAGKGNIYGGGSIAKVLGSVEISISDSKVWGNVYGGGDGVTEPGTVNVYQPDDPESYEPPYYTATKKSANSPWEVEWKDQVPAKADKAFEVYVWSNDAALLGSQYNGIDTENKRLYSPNTEGLGSVAGNTEVTIYDSVVEKNVYGGGNHGIVFGDSEVTIDGVSSEIKGRTFGGGNGDPTSDQTAILGAVRGNTKLTVLGGRVNEGYGGCNAADVGDTSSNNGNTALLINGGTVVVGFGGNNLKGDIKGQIITTLNGGHVEKQLYGGGNQADYRGITRLTILDGSVGDLDSTQNEGGTVNGSAYGGGKNASVMGTRVTMSGGKVRSLFGGSYMAPIVGYDTYLDAATLGPTEEETDYQAHVAITVDITGGEITTFLGGNDQQGENCDIDGDIIVNVGDKENPTTPTVVPSDSLRAEGVYPYIRNFFGGGNAADYNYKSDWEPNLHIRDELTPDTEFGGVRIFIHSGEIYQAFGGGVMADVTNTVVSVRGGYFHFIYGGGFRGNVTNSAIKLSGGLVYGDWLKYDQTELPSNTQGGYVFAGGYDGYVKNPNLHMEGGVIQHSLFGGGNLASVGMSAVVIKKGTVRGSVYGGGYNGDAGYDASGKPLAGDAGTYVEITGGSIGELVGGAGDYSYMGNIYGGGYRGKCLETHVDIVEYRFESSDQIRLGGSIFGGGHEAPIEGDTHVHFFNGEIDGNVYGGGRDGDVAGNCYVDIFDGSFGTSDGFGNASGGDIYGGGLNGTAQQTHVLITDKLSNISSYLDDYEEIVSKFNLAQSDVYIDIKGSVFGGGEGETATVTEAANVLVDLIYQFDVAETNISTAEITSGQISTTLTEIPRYKLDAEGNPTSTVMPYSVIGGSVYGGGDLGQAGVGSFEEGSNIATIEKGASLTVTIKSGHIMNHVFGGGNGVPEDEDSYKVTMGTVFGKTITNVYGGYIQGNIYGGGTQSRLYTADKAESVAVVSIDETEYGTPIAIGGSVFGGGDRGSSANINASIPTTIGDVEVKLLGAATAGSASRIYFLGHDGKGGVYGDGNYCLVSGRRNILLDHFHTGSQESLKTFYSLQRADSVVMNDSDVVLLGAVDLVDSEDANIYSINRVGALYMNDGSTIKLDRIVKLLGHLESDLEKERVFIDKGNNGTNGYILSGGAHPSDMLTAGEIDAYPADTSIEKNVVCIANGLYLEVMETDKVYGDVIGLFTLELLYAYPGEGGGFVYADIEGSTGDFICETKKGYSYAVVNAPRQEDFGTYYQRIPGRGYQKATGTFNASNLYFTRTETNAYMMVEDNVGGYADSVYANYYWYISGPIVYYTGDVTGYIGADDTSFGIDKTLPTHDVPLKYTLYGVQVNDTLANAVVGANKKYKLVQRRGELTGQEIAFEMISENQAAGSQSLGFLIYDEVNDKWGLLPEGESAIYGYNGDAESVSMNALQNWVVDETTTTVRLVLHKSVDVNAELRDMEAYIDIDLFDDTNQLYGGGVSTLSYTVGVNIVRLNPEQFYYASPVKGYIGVSNAEVRVTGNSAFTVQYITEYIPGAFPLDEDEGKKMEWFLSAEGYRFFMDEADRGFYLTVDAERNPVNMSQGLTYNGEELLTPEEVTLLGQHIIYHTTADGLDVYFFKDEDGNVLEFTERAAPDSGYFLKNTKITMIDLSNEFVPAYYYYLVDNDTTGKIDLLDFFVMGTQTTIRELVGDSNDTNDPEFITFYEKNAMTRVKENLVFIVDFISVNWNDMSAETETQFREGTDLILRHEYSDKDIMDYVRTEVEGEGEKFFRESPKTGNVYIDDDRDGLKENSTSASFVSNPSYNAYVQSNYPAGTVVYYDKDTAELKFTFALGELEILKDISGNVIDTNIWNSTLFLEGEFSLKIELLKDGAPCAFPIGVGFVYDSKEYETDATGMYTVIPLKGEGEHIIKINNALYSLADVVGDTATFRLTLFSAPDGNYYNTYGIDEILTCSYKIHPNPSYSIAVNTKGNDQIFVPGEIVPLQIDYKCSDSAELSTQKVSFSVEKSIASGYETCKLFGDKQPEFVTSKNMNLTLPKDAEIGTYRLRFEYGDCVEYLYLIVRSK